MTHTYLEEVRAQLTKGATQKDHPFRYFTLATVGLDQVPRLRTVVLRKLSEDLRMTFYTDSRSKKMIHLKENKKVGLLFYNPDTLTQIRIEGVALVVQDEETKKKYWSGIDKSARKDFTTASAPGTTLTSPEKLDYLDDEDHFCILEIVPFKIEYLKLKRPNHIRVRYSWEDGRWEGEFIVP
ncbi:Pyridoxine/pyridoxamine 5'-phosphate oxidase [Muriicola jejuensis]|uniref:Pyridoxamine 5'-phosphate oxidase family protein n=1 Tax=Muriicola jejuensis TaxID=504488 RepID=A0A6P0U792_9FLAO|nr:pyridoxamine 5'-phosphate oxidase family protein [Muriicola jejuensis]NER09007.1 pyridoxamine 5'-phosphate oxidase family protein [Muriicola jejuensis]SMP12241.1 Pyridoxine/pyridoxamine 5'-phosphate oxidase [Muriicola jejuensis]